MFEEVKLLGSPEQRIVVQTRKGRDVKNVIEPEPGFQQRQIYQRLLEKYGRRWHPRRPATGGYDCAGHVWASRRTGIFDPRDWRLILDDDGYRRLAPDEPPQPGDLVLYADNVNAEILHVGMILEMRQGITSDSPRLPWVLSKWGPVSGEVMHYAHDAPYASLGFSVMIDYWTDRPM